MMLHIKNINKYYGDFHALKDVSFEIKKGDVFCLLGPNGSGKTTLINCLLGLLTYKTGAFAFEDNYSEPTKRIGLVLEDDGFCRDMSVLKNLILTSIIKDASESEIDGLLDLLELKESKNKLVRKLSQGMRKRLSIASSLVGNPDFMIWDEPFNSLDPDGFIFVRGLVDRLNKNGKTFLICTHLLDEVERIADKVGLIYKGKLLVVMSKKEIIAEFGSIESFYIHYTKKY